MMRPQGAVADTTPLAADIQVDALRRLGPLARLELAWEMSVTARGLLRARLRQAQPEWTEDGVDQELRRYLYPVAPPALPR